MLAMAKGQMLLRCHHKLVLMLLARCLAQFVRIEGVERGGGAVYVWVQHGCVVIDAQSVAGWKQGSVAEAPVSYCLTL